MSNDTITKTNAAYIEKITKATKAATKRIDAIDDYNALEARTLRGIRTNLVDLAETLTAHGSKHLPQYEKLVDAHIRDLACEGVRI